MNASYTTKRDLTPAGAERVDAIAKVLGAEVRSIVGAQAPAVPPHTIQSITDEQRAAQGA